MAQANKPSKPTRITAWGLSVFLALAFLASGVSTLSGGMDAVLHGQLGVPLWALPVIGGIKIAAAIAMVIPASRFYGAAVLVATMLGAVMTHVVAADAAGSLPALVLGVMVGIVAWISRPAWVRAILQRRDGVFA